MAARLLAELAREAATELPLHRRNLSFVDDSLYRETANGLGFVEFRGVAKLGAVAMALRTLAASPLYDERRRQAEALAATIKHMMAPNGSFSPWFRGRSDLPPDRALTFYSGEAILALLEFADRSGRNDILDDARRAQNFYIHEYVTNLKVNYYPAYVPWHTMSLHSLFLRSCERRFAEAAFVLNDKLLEIQDTLAYAGRFFNPRYFQYGAPHSSSDGIYTEGLAYAYELARMLGDEPREGIYGRALERAVENLRSLQVTLPDSQEISNRPRSLGLVRTRHGSSLSRIDNTQHAIDAFRKVIRIWDRTQALPQPPSGLRVRCVQVR
ncbi:MAG: hypothetical protein ACREX4_20615 [Gammaproteobacteria bacterium]